MLAPLQYRCDRRSRLGDFFEKASNSVSVGGVSEPVWPGRLPGTPLIYLGLVMFMRICIICMFNASCCFNFSAISGAISSVFLYASTFSLLHCIIAMLISFLLAKA